ncbi:MAG: pyridoxal 5'-phosphate synthase glutaminase subunit PdxT [Anaerolineales bacterium]
MKRIGILAIQGDFSKHAQAVSASGHRAVEVRNRVQLEDTDGLIIPGGESTTFLRLFNEFGLAADIKNYARTKPILGTCAGLIILSMEADELPFRPLGLIDITVKRNAYGRQKDSFIDNIDLNLNGASRVFQGVFIRAPRIVKTGNDVRTLALHNGEAVLVANKKIMAATFHPELTDNLEIHKYFISKFTQ